LLRERVVVSSPAKPLLVGFTGLQVILGFLSFLPDGSQRLFQELGGLFAIRAFKPNRVDLDFSAGPNDDFDCSFHNYTHMRTSLMDPLGCGRRSTDSPFFLASMVALWTP
jgi:hypothetical protein